MTTKQNFLKFVYPLFKFLNKIFKRNANTYTSNTAAVRSFYNLTAILNNGETFNFEQLRHKKVLVVNTASDCGYTAQYKQLQKLYNSKQDKLTILAFPANDFMEQENKSDAEIDNFCKKNYGITFPLMRKSKVVVHSTQNSVFEWLTDKEQNGWNSQEPTWNFCKYLIDENGNLTHVFESNEEPLGKNITTAIEQ